MRWGRRKETSTASNPGWIRVKPLVYARYYPDAMKRFALGTGMILLGLVAAIGTRGASLLLIVFGLRRAIFGYRRLNAIARHFFTGNVLPGLVVNVEPFTVAALTDLSTGDEGVYDTVRIMPRPLEKVKGRAFSTGDRVVCVALYSGRMPSPKWDSFDPVPALFATDDLEALARVEATISEADWAELNEALFQIPKPYRNGLFPVNLLKEKP